MLRLLPKKEKIRMAKFLNMIWNSLSVMVAFLILGAIGLLLYVWAFPPA